MEQYFSGQMLYGDDFNAGEIADWYQDEKEGYAGLLKDVSHSYHYGRHEANKLHAFQFLREGKFKHVMGLGSAYGYEFLPIADRIENLYVLEPSDELVYAGLSETIRVVYQKPAPGGEIAFPDKFFDLIVCFDTLHHIPNVSTVFSEMARCLAPGGYLLVIEPITTMGDWREPRPGLTKRERGIPYPFFENLIRKTGLKVVHKSLYLTMTSFLTRKTLGLLGRPIYEYRTYLVIDKYLSRLLRWHICYHPKRWWQRIAPSQVCYVLTK